MKRGLSNCSNPSVPMTVCSVTGPSCHGDEKGAGLEMLSPALSFSLGIRFQQFCKSHCLPLPGGGRGGSHLWELSLQDMGHSLTCLSSPLPWAGLSMLSQWHTLWDASPDIPGQTPLLPQPPLLCLSPVTQHPPHSYGSSFPGWKSLKGRDSFTHAS